MLVPTASADFNDQPIPVAAEALLAEIYPPMMDDEEVDTSLAMPLEPTGYT